MKQQILTATIAAALALSAPLQTAGAGTDGSLSSAVVSTAGQELGDFDQVSDFAKKAMSRMTALGFFEGLDALEPRQPVDERFAQRLLRTTDDIGEGGVTLAEARTLIDSYLPRDAEENLRIAFEGFLGKLIVGDDTPLNREQFAYLVFHALADPDLKQIGTPIHNPAIASPGPLLGPTVFRRQDIEGEVVFDGSTISAFHAGQQAINTTFTDDPLLTLQVHPEVFQSVSVGGIPVGDLQDVNLQLEAELDDGTIHRTPLNSLTPFSVHGADGKGGEIRIEDGVLVLVDDLLGYVDTFEMNGRTVSTEDTIAAIQSQHYFNGDTASPEVVEVVVDELAGNGFSLQDRRILVHNVVLAKTALQQSSLTPLSAPFNTIAGPSSASRGFDDGLVYSVYRDLGDALAAGGLDDVLRDTAFQQRLLDATKVLTAATLLPHVTSLANAPFLPNEALSSRVKKAGSLLPSEPIAFQFDRLKRASYIVLDAALSGPNTSHLVTTGEIVVDESQDTPAFQLSADNFEAVPLAVSVNPVHDAAQDFVGAFNNLIQLITGVDIDAQAHVIDGKALSELSPAFQNPVLQGALSEVRIGDLEFEMDLLATPSHVLETFAPANDLTALRATEAFSFDSANTAFPERVAQYICNGIVVGGDGTVIGDANLKPEQQQDLLSDVGAYGDCIHSLPATRYRQLLFVDNFQLPPFGPEARFISAQGIEIINRLLFRPLDDGVTLKDLRLTYRLVDAKQNEAPTAAFVAAASVESGDVVTLDGGGSSDADGDTIGFHWALSEEGIALSQPTTPTPSFVAPDVSEDTVIAVTLAVDDGLVLSTPATREITVRASASSGGGGAIDLWFLVLVSALYAGALRRWQRMRNGAQEGSIGHDRLV